MEKDWILKVHNSIIFSLFRQSCTSCSRIKMDISLCPAYCFYSGTCWSNFYSKRSSFLKVINQGTRLSTHLHCCGETKLVAYAIPKLWVYLASLRKEWWPLLLVFLWGNENSFQCQAKAWLGLSLKGQSDFLSLSIVLQACPAEHINSVLSIVLCKNCELLQGEGRDYAFILKKILHLTNMVLRYFR